MALTLTVTNAGRDAVVNAEGTGTAPLTITQVGLSATAVAAVPTATALAGEFKRVAAAGGGTVAPDTIHLIARDDSADAFTMRSFALYLADGTLFALYGQAGAIVEKTASSIALLQCDIKFADIAAASLTFGDLEFINPPASETVKGVAEIATQAETDAGADDQRIVTPKKLMMGLATWAAVTFGDVWRASNDGSGSGLDADLLDGQHGSYYGNIPARLGYTPANKAGDTFTGTVAAPSIEISSGDLFLSRTNGSTAQILRPNLAGYKSLKIGVSGGGNLDTLELASLSVTIRGNMVWHAGNDGAGSGLDADLLDGQDSNYFTNIVARLGYTPLNASLYTAADILAKLATVDGSGSGLDADLLDGINSSGFLRANAGAWVYSTDGIARFYFADVTFIGGGPQGWSFQYGGVNRVTISTGGNIWTAGSIQSTGNVEASDGNAVSRIAANGDITTSRAGGVEGVVWFGNGGNRYLHYSGSTYNLVNAPLYVNGGYVWTSTNDGAGSGLDADTLDGKHANAFLEVTASYIVENGGYRVTADGLKETWGFITIGPDSIGTYNLPVGHSSWVNPVISAYWPANQTVSQHATDWYQTLYNGAGQPYAIQFWNADDRYVRVHVQTKGV
ncbi:hypothetical protein [Sphingobium sp. B11D3D]|uniref:hypothetical protein n=1 Tax=Sphingobium sp. B11D3D TaxID=2940576 RepID=UPI0022250952|nr:hypothetical protein [Sphingobium sp. B11D3D]MCW2370197.1 hypothetical protein [Sphingobium sp. B11D3D]